MTIQTPKVLLFWIKHSLIVLIAGLCVGFLGYKNMKMTAFEIILNNSQHRDKSLTYSKPISHNSKLHTEADNGTIH